MRFKYTKQQLAAAEAFAEGKSLKIKAFAGAGKTTILKHMAERERGRGLYLAYNNQIARESASKFPSHVTCKTAHALALGGLPNELREKASQAISRLPRGALVQYLMQRAGLVETEAKEIAPVADAAIHWFCVSADPRPTFSHIDRALQGIHTTAGPDEIMVALPAVWEGISTADGGLPMTFDGYLKVFQLKGAPLDFDYVLADEAQDLYPAIQSIIRGSGAQEVWVGDSHQQLYGFNGADNAMQRLDYLDEYPLTFSWRFGEWLAELVQPILNQLGEPDIIRGNPEIKTRRSLRTLPVRLARGNATLLAPLVASIKAKKRVHVLGGAKKLNALLDAAECVMRERRVRTGLFAGINSWLEARKRAEEPGNYTLQAIVELIEKHRLSEVRRCVAAVSDAEDHAEVVLGTVHQAKGREFDKVALLDDFRAPREFLCTLRGKDVFVPPPEILRLVYVAITRASEEVFVPVELARRYNIHHELKRSKPRTQGDSPTSVNESPDPYIPSTEVSPLTFKPHGASTQYGLATAVSSGHERVNDASESTREVRIRLIAVMIWLALVFLLLEHKGYLDFLPFF